MSRIPFPVIGIYSSINFSPLRDLNCNTSMSKTLTRANARLKLKLVVGISIYANIASISVKITLIKSIVYHNIFATSITKNNVTIYILIPLFSCSQSISSKNWYIVSNNRENAIPTLLLGAKWMIAIIVNMITACTNTPTINGDACIIGIHRDCRTNNNHAGTCCVKNCTTVSICVVLS